MVQSLDEGSAVASFSLLQPHKENHEVVTIEQMEETPVFEAPMDTLRPKSPSALLKRLEGVFTLGQPKTSSLYELVQFDDPLNTNFNKTTPEKLESKAFVQNLDGCTKIRESFLGWISLILAQVSSASIGPVFKYMTQHGVRVCLSASWRCQAMSIFLIPLAIFESCSSPANKVDWLANKPQLSYPVVVHLLISGLAWSASLLCWIIALQYTTTFKASVLCSIYPLLLVAWMKIKGISVSKLEGVGVLISFIGLLLSSLPALFYDINRGSHDKIDRLSNIYLNSSDSNYQNRSIIYNQDSMNEINVGYSPQHFDARHELLGITLCLFTSFCEAVIIFNRIAIRPYVPLMQYTAFTTVIVCLCSTIVSLLLEGYDLIPSPVEDYRKGIYFFCLQDNCVLGWLSEKWRSKVLIFGLWVGVICISGFNYAMQVRVSADYYLFPSIDRVMYGNVCRSRSTFRR